MKVNNHPETHYPVQLITTYSYMRPDKSRISCNYGTLSDYNKKKAKDAQKNEIHWGTFEYVLSKNNKVNYMTMLSAYFSQLYILGRTG